MYIFGKNVAEEYLKKQKKVKKIYLSKNFKENLPFQNIPITYLEKYEMDKMVNGLHQGIILEVEDYQYASLSEIIEKENALIVILDHLEDPHNFGAITRTCEAAGVNGIIIPKDRSVEVNATVIKVSTGATENIPIARVTNIVQTIKELKEKGFWIVGSDMQGTDYDKIDYRGKTAIIIGNEGSGMSRLVKENCDFIATIPMKGKTESLNASVSAGILIYEAIKSRNL
ncbi:MAG: 23S rRNA (guanosine(2251)-2'-O)-methyltransferase RlmB [Tenericutes bacterium]|nr:23S rRNA (guanosine(2251)-2'-O)-methyltransferase RlmB [Mycoplasmatota bacterium]